MRKILLIGITLVLILNSTTAVEIDSNEVKITQLPEILPYNNSDSMRFERVHTIAEDKLLVGTSFNAYGRNIYDIDNGSIEFAGELGFYSNYKAEFQYDEDYIYGSKLTQPSYISETSFIIMDYDFNILHEIDNVGRVDNFQIDYDEKRIYFAGDKAFGILSLENYSIEAKYYLSDITDEKFPSKALLNYGNNGIVTITHRTEDHFYLVSVDTNNGLSELQRLSISYNRILDIRDVETIIADDIVYTLIALNDQTNIYDITNPSDMKFQKSLTDAKTGIKLIAYHNYMIIGGQGGIAIYDSTDDFSLITSKTGYIGYHLALVEGDDYLDLYSPEDTKMDVYRVNGLEVSTEETGSTTEETGSNNSESEKSDVNSIGLLFILINIITLQQVVRQKYKVLK